MPRSAKKPQPPTKRMASYRDRMRAAGLKPVQIWIPDSKAPGFADKCRQQAMMLAKRDPAGDEALRFIQASYEWPV